MPQVDPPALVRLSEGLGPLLDGWANVEGVRFVNRSSGQYTTATVSRNGLVELMQAAQAAERARISAHIEAWLHCPCCGKVMDCTEDCTFAVDCPDEAENMGALRDALRA